MDRNYLAAYYKIIKEQNVNVRRIQERPVDEVTGYGTEEVDSARGIYVNFLNVNGKLFRPTFDLLKLEISDKHNSGFEQLLVDNKIVNYEIQSDELYKLGGGLHCVSWCY